MSIRFATSCRCTKVACLLTLPTARPKRNDVPPGERPSVATQECLT
jgi:hypothetical protein